MRNMARNKMVGVRVTRQELAILRRIAAAERLSGAAEVLRRHGLDGALLWIAEHLEAGHAPVR